MQGIDIKRGLAGTGETYQNNEILIVGNQIYSNADAGVSFDQSQVTPVYCEDIKVKDNWIHSNTNQGIIAEYTQDIDITGNTVRDNGQTGIYLFTDNIRPSINNNTVYDNGDGTSSYFGINVLNATSPEIYHNECFNRDGTNQARGINVASCTGVRIGKNFAKDNSYFQIIINH